MKINIIVAHDKNNGIGYENKLPWNIKSDLKNFKKFTVGQYKNAVVMGSNTWKSIQKPLPNRDNLILSNSLKYDYKFVNSNNTNTNLVKTFTSIEHMIDFCIKRQYQELWVIGGNKVYNSFLNNDKYSINSIYITYIDTEFKCDTYFPKIDTNRFRFMQQSIHRSYTPLEYDIYDQIYCVNDLQQ